MSNVYCRNCKSFLGKETYGNEIKKTIAKCPNCGCTDFDYEIILDDNISMHEQIKIKTKETGKKPSEKIFGEEPRREGGGFVQKTRIIDRENDKYFEKVTDPETQKVIHLCDEPLSEHTRHGSAKR